MTNKSIIFKLFAVLTAISLACAMFTACSNGSDDDSSSSSTNSSSATKSIVATYSGVYTLVFYSDNTCTGVMGGNALQGTYTGSPTTDGSRIVVSYDGGTMVCVVSGRYLNILDNEAENGIGDTLTLQ